MAIMQLVSFLIVLTLKPLLVTCTHTPVLDYEGKPLLWNNSYRILPNQGFPFHGGIGIEHRSDIEYIVQQKTDQGNRGLPVSFIPKENINSGDIVYESSNILIQFHIHEDVNSNQWKVAKKTGKYFLISGEKKGKGDWFQIVNAGDHFYKIVYCQGQSCKGVGPEQDYQYRSRRFVVDKALLVNLHKIHHPSLPRLLAMATFTTATLPKPIHSSSPSLNNSTDNATPPLTTDNNRLVETATLLLSVPLSRKHLPPIDIINSLFSSIDNRRQRNNQTTNYHHSQSTNHDATPRLR
ncbi:hypothetical protein ACFE04_006607 [Oxalis oulophora]